jgi:hypothetical protein
MAVFTGLGSAASPSITFSADTNTGIFSPGADQVAVATNGTVRLFINSTGLVGIGTSSPGAAIDVRGGVNGASNEEVCVFARPDGLIRSSFRKGVSTGAGFSYGTTTNHPLALRTSDTERLYITQTGLVGIGTTSPAVAFDIAGRARALTGILFGSDTAEANALDDYEEGDWTPGNLDPVFDVSVARYIKIGRLVHAWFVTINGNTSDTYDLPNNIQGLPYVRRMTNPYGNYGLVAGTVSVINTITYSGSQIVWNGVVTGRFNAQSGCNIRWKNDTTHSPPNLRPQIVNAPSGGLYFDFHVVYEALS